MNDFIEPSKILNAIFVLVFSSEIAQELLLDIQNQQLLLINNFELTNSETFFIYYVFTELIQQHEAKIYALVVTYGSFVYCLMTSIQALLQRIE